MRSAKTFAGIPILFGLLFSPFLSTRVDAQTEWNQLGQNAQRTAYVPTEVPTPWQVKWIWNGPAGGGDSGPAAGHLRLPRGVQPIVGDGKVYVGHSDGLVRAISESTGQVVWTSINLGAGIINTGAYDPSSTSVYFGAQNGKFYQLDSATGTQKRVVDLHNPIDMAPLLAGNTVYIGSRNGTLYALDKDTLTQRWSYEAGAELVASPSYSANYGGLVILLAEDKSVHALQVSNGSRRWRVTVNGDGDPLRGNRVFADTFPVVSDVNDVVIVRSYLLWDKMWLPTGGAPSTVTEIRNYLTQNPTYQSFFVLELNTGVSRFVAPVMVGAIGNGGDFESVSPQAVVKRLPDNSEVAYVLWRSRQACLTFCDGREDSTIGELNLQTGNLRFVRDYKNAGSVRLPTDEQSPLSMAGNSIFHAHWMLLGGVRITDRSSNLGSTYSNPIAAQELAPVLNTLASGSCGNRSGHFCPQAMTVPCDGFGVDSGFYVYYASGCAYDQYWTTPVRSAVISNGVIYFKSNDGAITAVGTSATPAPPPGAPTNLRILP
jgi:outer membrane protein assembly factor BamB